MHLRTAPERQNHTRDITFREPRGIRNHQLRSHLRVVRRYADEVAVPFTRVLVSRNETALLQAMHIPSKVRIELPIAEIEPPIAVGDAAADIARSLCIERLGGI